MKRKLLIIPAIFIGLMALGALSVTPAEADTPTPTATPGLPSGAYSCTVGLSGAVELLEGSYSDYNVYPFSGPIDTPGTYPDVQIWHGNSATRIVLRLPLSEPIWSDGGAYPSITNGSSGIAWDVSYLEGPGDIYSAQEADALSNTGGVVDKRYFGSWPSGYREYDSVEVTWDDGAYYWLNGVSIPGYCMPSATSTPTPAPTGTVVPFVHINEPCITATVAAPLPTPTLFSLTPQPTPTPGGPTATPNVVAAEPIVANFDTDFSPLVSISNQPKWLPAPSAKASDQIGVAFLPWNLLGAPDSDKSLIYIASTPLSGHYRIKGYVRTENIPAGDHAFVRVWGLRLPDYIDVRLSTDGDETQISTDWTFWSVEVNDPAQYSELRITTYIWGAGSDWVNDSLADYPGARLDDITIAIGDDQVQASYPVCSAPGSGVTPMKFCPITITEVDVYADRCTQPDSLLVDIGGYLSWLGCRITTYFTILPQNQGQLDTIIISANHTEPFGSMLESKTALEYVGGKISDYLARYQSYSHKWDTINWSLFYNWQALVNIHLPDPTDLRPDMSIYNCSLGDIQNLPESVKRTGCMVEAIVSNTGLAAPLQLLIDIIPVIGLILYIRSTWMSKGGGDDE